MQIKVEKKNYTKDSNGDIVTIEWQMTGHWLDGTKVYDETFMWNPPWDKRIPRNRIPVPDIEARKKLGEDGCTEQTKIDVIINEWDSLVMLSNEYRSHHRQAELKVQQEVFEPTTGTLVPAKA